MEIQIDPHTLERAQERGASEQEIKDAIETGFDIPAKYGRMGKAKVYDFKQKRHGKYYEQKRIEALYTIEENSIVTVTAYVFYGKWEV
jgi:DNA modification methylase